MLALVVGGCASVGNLTSIYRSPDIGDGDSLVLDAEQWAVLNMPSPADSNRIICTMPSPDALAAAAASGSLSAEGQGAGDSGSGSAAGAFSLGESAASIGLRTQSIQLLRDAMFRMCEAHANGGIDAVEFGIMMRRFQTNMVAILAIEQLTGTVVAPPVAVSASGEGTIIDSMVRRRREIREEISILQTRIDAIPENEEDEVKKARRTRMVQEQSDLREDLEVYQSIISAMTSGDFATAEALLGHAPLPNSRSDEDIARVAQTVESITLAAMSHNYQEEMCYELDRLTIMQRAQVTAERAQVTDACNALIDANVSQRLLVSQTVQTVLAAFVRDNQLSADEIAALRALMSEIDQHWTSEDLREFESR